MAAPGPEAPAPPGGGGLGAGGSGGSQILQQIEALLAQLAQSEPEPEVQRAIQGIQKQIEPLQQVLGAQDAQNMQGGLANPTGGGGAGGLAGGGAEEPPEPGGAPAPGGGGGEGEPHTVEIHIKPGGPKTFGEAKKAAMAMHAERGHFDHNTPKGETPSTPRTKARSKG